MHCHSVSLLIEAHLHKLSKDMQQKLIVVHLLAIGCGIFDNDCDWLRTMS
ncbi:hypothetical protein PS887_01347 [Pseudomonas fluorescens]|nr:hypothetical protein PS887_01347 [Pseudomonas fluorescens]